MSSVATFWFIYRSLFLDTVAFYSFLIYIAICLAVKTFLILITVYHASGYKTVR